MQFKKSQLVKILGCSQATEDKWIEPINAACEKFKITTKLRLAAFIAQVGHESGRLGIVTENLNYSADGLQKTWPSRFNEENSDLYERKPEKIANKVYYGRMGNGDESSGDGWKYRGRGLIQCTGKSNYDAFSQACGVDAVSNPDSLAEPTNAALSAAWFWGSKGLNAYADKQDFLTITKRINGGTHGQADRELLYKKALIVLGDEEPPKDEEELKEAPVPQSPTANTAPVTEQKTPAAQNSSIVEPRAASGSSGKSQYPWNLVYESRSGHRD
jgi:putative chitinase